jgi:nicotinamidase/pyrazinamidase
VADTWDADFVPDLVVDGPAIQKGTGGEDGYSGFSVRDVETGTITSTELAQLLSAGGVRVIVLCGLATDYCVKETARYARVVPGRCAPGGRQRSVKGGHRRRS